jgi:hypothetical protein
MSTKTTQKVTPVPSKTAQNRALGTALIKAAATFAKNYKGPKNGTMTPEQVIAQVNAWMSYIPGDFDPRLGTPGSAGGRRSSSAA